MIACLTCLFPVSQVGKFSKSSLGFGLVKTSSKFTTSIALKESILEVSKWV